MSTINLAKKLQPAKKAWKSFTSTLQSKLRKIKICETIKRTKKHCITALHKLYALTRRSTTRCRYHLYHHHQCHHHQKSYSTIYIDELFPKPSHDTSSMQPSKVKEIIASSSGVNKAKAEETTNMEKKQQNDHNVATIGVKIVDKNVMPEKGKAGESSSKLVAADKLKLPMLPQFRGIDEKAEEFISKFREEMKLERQKSILDFQEMLDRSV